jgi:epoxide hydrolase-like predicted phosphatase
LKLGTLYNAIPIPKSKVADSEKKNQDNSINIIEDSNLKKYPKAKTYNQLKINYPMKTIIFDLGGVVLNRGIWIFHDYLSEEFKIPREKIVQVMIKTYYKDYFSGKISEEEYWTKCLKDLNIEADWKELREKLIEFFEPQKEVIELISILKQKGHQIGLLSDQTKEWWSELDKKHDLSKEFNFTIISAIEGITKPDLEIYQLMLSKTKNKPKNCIYIDDLKYNLPPAKNLGVQTIFFNNPNQLKEELTKILK